MPKSDNQKTLVLLDAHAILHRAYHALPDFSTAKGEPTGGLYGLSTMLIKIIGDLKPDYLAAAYDLPGPTYRHEAYEAYKARRPKLEDDLTTQIKRSGDIFRALDIPIYEKAGFEADDVLGTIVEQTKKEKNLKIIIASGDMDTLQLVEGNRVTVFTLRKGLSDTVTYNEKAVETRFGFGPTLLPDFKGLRGDPSDNIPGVRGIGEKTATTLITKFGTLENIYKTLKKSPEELIKAGITERLVGVLKENEEEAEFSKMLSTIRRDAPIKFELGNIWSPNLEKVENFFGELEFRTLAGRLKEALKKDEEAGPEPAKKQLSLTKKESGDTPIEVEEIEVALWLLDSNITNPTQDDIFSRTKTRDFEKAKGVILKEIKEKDLSFVYEEIEKPLIPVARGMEKRGIKVDRAYLGKLSKDYHKELAEREKSIWKEAGEEFNINSPKQLGQILFEKLALSVKGQKKTTTGMKSTRESELEKFRDVHPIIPHILEYRQFQKLLSTYIDNIPKELDDEDRLHTNLRLAGSTTGRMASTNPNLQNIPIKTELGRNIRKAFVSERGFSLLSFDYSQIELRIAAILSRDEKLLEIFRGAEDVHTATAVYVFKVSPHEVTKEMRIKAKTINFGILYGMGVTALRQNLGTSREEAQKFYNDYFSTFKGLAEYIDKVKSDASAKGYTETLFGRRRYVEAINSKIPYIKAAAERMAGNAPFQGTAADIIKIAMRDISSWIKRESLGDKVFMLLQVHDELLFEVTDEIAETVAPKIRQIMESALPRDKSEGVPIEANAYVGKNWGDLSPLN